MQVNIRKSYNTYSGHFLDIVSGYKKKPEMLMFLEIILTLSTSAVLLIFALRPTVLTITQLYKDIKAKEEVIVKLDNKIANLTQARTNYNNEQSRIAILKSAIPDKPLPDKFALQLQGIVYTDKVELTNLSLTEADLLGNSISNSQAANPLPENANSFTANLNTKGNFGTITDFVAHVENMRRPVRFNNMNLFIREQDESVDTLYLNITGEVPFIK